MTLVKTEKTRFSCERVESGSWEILCHQDKSILPYHTLFWGELVQRIFGGKFITLKVDCGSGSYFIPVLSNSQLSLNQYVSGHIGYGGIFNALGEATYNEQLILDVMDKVSDYLEVSCNRLVLPPSPDELGIRIAEKRMTYVLSLEDNEKGIWANYSAKNRNIIRKSKSRGVMAREAKISDLPDIIQLISNTQSRVGASYQTPSTIISDIMNSPTKHRRILVSTLENNIISVGIFLVHGSKASYIFNGWNSEYKDCSPNYVMLDEAFIRLQKTGIKEVDLGYSHSSDLARSKKKWGAEPRYFYIVNGGNSNG